MFCHQPNFLSDLRQPTSKLSYWQWLRPLSSLSSLAHAAQSSPVASCAKLCHLARTAQTHLAEACGWMLWSAHSLHWNVSMFSAFQFTHPVISFNLCSNLVMEVLFLPSIYSWENQVKGSFPSSKWQKDISRNLLIPYSFIKRMQFCCITVALDILPQYHFSNTGFARVFLMMTLLMHIIKPYEKHRK